MKKIPTTDQMYWQILKDHHPSDLSVYSTATYPGGSRYVETVWCFKGSEFPLVGALTTWDSENDGKRENEKHEYWMYAITKEDLDNPTQDV